MVEQSTHEPKLEGSYPAAIGTVKLKNIVLLRINEALTQWYNSQCIILSLRVQIPVVASTGKKENR